MSFVSCWDIWGYYSNLSKEKKAQFTTIQEQIVFQCNQKNVSSFFF